MTTYYISPNGSNSNNGLGPDASAATNKPWLTLGKATNTGSVVVPGDIVYIAPGYYYAAACIPIAGISSSGSPTQIIGDPTNAQGFKDGSGVRLAPGLPWLTTRTSGEGINGTIASTSTLITGVAAGSQFRYLVLEAGFGSGGVIAQVDYATFPDVLFDRCVLIGRTILFAGSGAPTAARNWTIQRCVIYGNVFAGTTTTAAATADADLNFVIQENFIVGAICNTALGIGASGGNIGGGIYIYNNTIIATYYPIRTTALRISTVKPIKVKGNLILGGGVLTTYEVGTSGQVIDDGYNLSMSIGNTNVTTGTGSLYGTPMLNLVLPNLTQWGLEMPRADMFGWTDAAHANQKFSASGIVTADFRGRTIRPWGAGASAGCWQAQSLAQDATSVITGGGTNSLKLTGAGEVSLYIPVDATGFTVSVTTESTTYGGANYPQLTVVANPSVGVTSDTTATASSASEQTITTATITPTAKGVMEVRLISRSTTPTSSTYFDLLAAA